MMAVGKGAFGVKTEGTNTFQAVYRLTGQIPYGRVTTYGQLARLIGNPRLSRIVGCALNAAPEGLPCHRVVNRQGGLSDAFLPLGRDSQRLLDISHLTDEEAAVVCGMVSLLVQKKEEQ